MTMIEQMIERERCRERIRDRVQSMKRMANMNLNPSFGRNGGKEKDEFKSLNRCWGVEER